MPHRRQPSRLIWSAWDCKRVKASTIWREISSRIFSVPIRAELRRALAARWRERSKRVDPEAEFLFVPANQVVEKAAMSITSTVAVLQKLKEDGFLRADFPLARYLTGSQ